MKRKTPILPYDADVRTVYVESIPVTGSREWLEKVFSDFGHVAYISLPKFKNSQKIKVSPKRRKKQEKVIVNRNIVLKTVQITLLFSFTLSVVLKFYLYLTLVSCVK